MKSSNCIIAFASLLALAAQFAVADSPFSVSTPTSDIVLARGAAVDVPFTFGNGNVVTPADGTFVMGPADAQTGYHFEQRSKPRCGDVVSDDGGIWNGYYHFAVPAIPAGGSVTCTLRISRDPGSPGPMFATWTFAAGGESDDLFLRIGAFTSIGIVATRVDRTLDPTGILTVVDLTLDNAGAAAVDATTYTATCDPALYAAVLDGGCSVESPLICTPNQLQYGERVHWPTIPAGSSHTCRFQLRAPLGMFDANYPASVNELADHTTSESLLNASAFVVAQLPTDLSVDGIDLNQSGLSGSWANPATPAQGLVVNVQPDFYGAGKAMLFAGWFTYDAIAGFGPRWYTLQATLDGKVSDSPIYRTTEGRFDLPDATTTVQVGTATVGFNDCATGVLRYTFDDGRVGAILLNRLLPNVSCHAAGLPPAQADAPMSGTWADPSSSGQGLVVDIDPVHSLLFAGWFTYTPGIDATGVSGQRWFTLQGTMSPNSADLVIYASANGAFDQPHPATTTPVGSAHFTLQSCTSARLDYAFTSGEGSPSQGTLHLARLGNPPAGCVR